ncbi:hypothetical protein CTAYLR_005597 [Chrysophaeum taylorii]|uniref:Phosphoglycerate mutase n=1 Tax=Chrysophaeum taylorii TaxID=2483200 RepID=A0AAD7XFY7_9STRA|nr:hypothetical protein CTAYLR_005597 [Chrysophaeum taylorii]
MLLVFMCATTLPRAVAFVSPVLPRSRPSLRRFAEEETPYELVLLRHGESTWNDEGLFTGWYDCPLSAAGEAEAIESGKLLKEQGYIFDLAFTSYLKRAISTLWYCLTELDQQYVPTVKSWRLNERHYGALQGLDKKSTVAQHGTEQVNIWRRSYDIPPPPVDEDSEHYPGNDMRYRNVPEDLLPKCESLKLTEDRVLDDWENLIKPEIAKGKRVLIAAHGNSLRALAKILDDIPPDVIAKLNLPTGVPLVYELDRTTFKPIKHPDAIAPLSGRYLGDLEDVKARIGAVVAQTGPPVAA